MVAPNREIVNINSFTTSSAMSNLTDSISVSEDIQMGALRDKSTIASMNSLIVLSILSKASSVEYAAFMEVQNLNLIGQTKLKISFFNFHMWLSREGSQTSKYQQIIKIACLYLI